MIIHKTFTEPTASLTGKRALAKREEIRKKAEEFIKNEIDDEDVINITETFTSLGSLFSVTIWYKKR